MSIVTVRFTTHWPPNPTSLIISRLGGSKEFSHCLSIVDGVAYEATMLRGCRETPLEAAMQGVATYQDMYVPVKNLQDAVNFGKAQDGKGYDFAGAFGIPFLASEDWADDRKWWCSEHTFAMLGAAGNWLLDPNVVRRVAPIHLLMCNYPKSKKVYLNKK